MSLADLLVATCLIHPLQTVLDGGFRKAMGKLTKELGGLRGRLKNPKFVESAPAEVVEETRQNLALRQGHHSRC